MGVEKYQVRVKSAPEALERFKRGIAGCKFVWNTMLRLNKDIYAEYGMFAFYKDMQKLIKEVDNDKLKGVPAQCLQNTLWELSNALEYGSHHKESFPKFRKAYRDVKMTFYKGYKFKDGRVYLPKIGWLSMLNPPDIDFSKISKIEGRLIDKKYYVILYISVGPSRALQARRHATSLVRLRN